MVIKYISIPNQYQVIADERGIQYVFFPTVYEYYFWNQFKICIGVNISLGP